MAAHSPAQRELVRRLIDWERIRTRCARYPAIQRAFPLRRLESRREDPPYYCHYMAWRLGTWGNETLFQRLDELLLCAERLPNWKHERSLLGSAEFSDYWSLVWQLQVAEYLCKVGKDVSWTKAGPDLAVTMDGSRWYVECYKPTKSFGLVSFLEEVLTRVHEDIRVYYDLCLPLDLPKNLERSHFLDDALDRFLDHGKVKDAAERAKCEYPVVLYEGPRPSSALQVYMEGGDSSTYVPGIVRNKTGDPGVYARRVLQEAVNAKTCANDLRGHRPNLLAVNYLLSTGFQLATQGRWGSEDLAAACELGSNIDALAVCALGIDTVLTREDLRVSVWSGGVNRSSLERIAHLV